MIIENDFEWDRVISRICRPFLFHRCCRYVALPSSDTRDSLEYENYREQFAQQDSIVCSAVVCSCMLFWMEYDEENIFICLSHTFIAHTKSCVQCTYGVGKGEHFAEQNVHSIWCALLCRWFVDRSRVYVYLMANNATHLHFRGVCFMEDCVEPLTYGIQGYKAQNSTLMCYWIYKLLRTNEAWSAVVSFDNWFSAEIKWEIFLCDSYMVMKSTGE